MKIWGIDWHFMVEGPEASGEKIPSSSRQPGLEKGRRHMCGANSWQDRTGRKVQAFSLLSRFSLGWLIFLFLLMLPAGLLAQMPGHLEPAGGVRFSVSAAPLYQFKSDVNGGGDFSVARYFLSANGSAPINDRLRFGAGLTYDFEDYDFSNLSGFAVPKPWDRIDRVSLSARLTYKIGENWNLLAGPVVQYAGEEGADFGRSLLYGGTIGASYRASRNFVIGFGAGIFYRLEETRIFPSLIVSWKITDRWRLGNSYRVGPAGPAGMELGYMLDKGWDIGVGAGYRSLRFRLDKGGPVPSGIGEINSWPVYVRLGGKIVDPLNFDVYAGAAFGGKLKLEDRHGNEINNVGYETAPMVGFTLSASF